MRQSGNRSSILGLGAVTLTLALVAAACGSDSDEGGSADAPAGGGETITLVRNAWTASALNVEVAKQLIEENFGNTVEITDIDENLMFEGLSRGELDAALELWPSGITADEQAFFDDGSVVEIGELGAVGRIGWFVPDYVLEEFPSVATWEGFKDPEIAKQFASAETGDNGRFLGTDPSYSQADASIVELLSLPLEVVYSGSEAATVAELDSKVAAKEPIVMYWWTPTAAAAKYNLQKVELPAYSDECYADAAKIDCDYPEDVMVKIASSKLAEKDAAVYGFLQKFQLTTEDQLSMLPAAEIDGTPAAEVAAKWIADNEAVWKAWL